MHLQVGRGGCKKGVCTEFVNSEDMTVEFPHLGIQCVRRRDVESSLRERRDIRVDPFRQGFRHMDNNGNIDLNAVKLCFQVTNLHVPVHVSQSMLEFRRFWRTLAAPANTR